MTIYYYIAIFFVLGDEVAAGEKSDGENGKNNGNGKIKIAEIRVTAI